MWPASLQWRLVAGIAVVGSGYHRSLLFRRTTHGGQARALQLGDVGCIDAHLLKLIDRDEGVSRLICYSGSIEVDGFLQIGQRAATRVAFNRKSNAEPRTDSDLV